MPSSSRKREFFIVNLLVRIHFIIVMIRWTGLVPLVSDFPFPGRHDDYTIAIRAGGTACPATFWVDDLSVISESIAWVGGLKFLQERESERVGGRQREGGRERENERERERVCVCQKARGGAMHAERARERAIRAGGTACPATFWVDDLSVIPIPSS